MKLASARRLLLPLIPLYQLALAVRELWLLLGLEPVRAMPDLPTSSTLRLLPKSMGQAPRSPTKTFPFNTSSSVPARDAAQQLQDEFGGAARQGG